MKKQYDVVVCGGGFSGFAAAYSAAREGASTLLVERNGCLGGVGTMGLVNHLLGARCYDNGRIFQSVGGIYKTLEETMLCEGGGVDFRKVNYSLNPHGWYPSLGTGLIFDPEKMKLVLEEMLEDVGCEILYMTDIIDVIKNDDAVCAICVHNKSGTYEIYGKSFVDASGDGDVCRLSGCRFEKGDEEGGMAAASLEMQVENVDYEKLSAYMENTSDFRFRSIISKLKESGEWTFDYDIFISVMLTEKDKFMINTIRQVGIDGTDAQSITRGIISGRKENYKLFDIMKKHFPGFENARIYKIAPTIGIRETVRIEGEYTLTVEDLINAVEFDDTVAISSYGWDLPHPKSPSVQPYHGVERKSPFTRIPYRCLVPQGVRNLLVVGRCISVQREVLGPVRVMAPCIAMGEAAGIAASIVAKNAICAKDVNISELKEKLGNYGAVYEEAQIKEINYGI